MPKTTKPYLIADIGGTNARFALADSENYYQPLVLAVDKFPSPADALDAYLQYVQIPCPPFACLGIAAPVDRDSFGMTNCGWVFDKAELRQRFGFEQLHFINDFAALALAVPQLPAEQVDLLGAVEGEGAGPKAVLGPGTGLGVAALLQTEQAYRCVASEAAHIAFNPSNDLEHELLEYLYTQYDRVSFERLLCGRGLQQIYQALCAMKSRGVVYTSAEEVSRLALAGEDDLAMAAMDLLLDILASFAGDVGLMYAAVGGVYLGGGVAVKHRSLITSRDMRTRFSGSKGRLSSLLERTPLYLINTELSALHGVRLALDTLVVQGWRCF